MVAVPSFEAEPGYAPHPRMQAANGLHANLGSNSSYTGRLANEVKQHFPNGKIALPESIAAANKVFWETLGVQSLLQDAVGSVDGGTKSIESRSGFLGHTREATIGAGKDLVRLRVGSALVKGAGIVGAVATDAGNIAAGVHYN